MKERFKILKKNFAVDKWWFWVFSVFLVVLIFFILLHLISYFRYSLTFNSHYDWNIQDLFSSFFFYILMYGALPIIKLLFVSPILIILGLLIYMLINYEKQVLRKWSFWVLLLLIGIAIWFVSILFQKVVIFGDLQSIFRINPSTWVVF